MSKTIISYLHSLVKLTSYALLSFFLLVNAFAQYSVDLSKGMNLVGFPIEGVTDSYALIQALGNSSQVDSVLIYNKNTNKFDKTFYNANGLVEGVNAAIDPSHGWIVYAKTDFSIVVDDTIACPTITLTPGLNVVSFPCASQNMLSRNYLQYLGGPQSVANIQSYNADSARFLISAYANGAAIGDDFELDAGKAYFVETYRPIMIAQLEETDDAVTVSTSSVTTPSDVLFTFPSSTTENLSSISIDFEGNGTIDYFLDEGLNGDIIAQTTYTTGGEFNAVITLVGLDGQVRVFERKILIESLPEAPVGVALETPIENSVIAGNVILVSGRFTGPAETKIFVNGIEAITINDSYYLNNLQLTPGIENTLTIEAVSPGGNSATRSYKVTSERQSYAYLVPNTSRGFSPLDVAFTTETAPDFSITSLSADFVETGSFVDQAINNIVNTYESDRVYISRFNIQLANAGTAVEEYAEVAIIIENLPQVEDAKIRNQFAQFLTDLDANNINSAKMRITPQYRARYENTLLEIQAAGNLQNMVTNFGILEEGYFGDEWAEYTLVRSLNGINEVFVIHFIKESDGNWYLYNL